MPLIPLKSLFLSAILGASLACTEPYDICMDKVSAQTSAPEETLHDLSCADLTDILSLPLPEDYILLQDENAVVITHCSLPYFGSSRLQQNQLCYEQIKEFLGIQPITQCIMETLAFDGDAQELFSQYVPGGAAGCMMIHSVAVGKKGNCLRTEQQYTEATSCAPHEPTHIFVAGTVLYRDPPWLNEGLADYVMTSLDKNQSLECFPEGFRYMFNDSDSGEVKEIKEGEYVPLDLTRKKHQEAGTSFDAYLTGACLWDHIDRTHGPETFKAIMQDVQGSRLISLSFIDDILLRHLGESGIEGLKNRFGKESIEIFE